MVNDPYEVLGISRDADSNEIKKAYRKKAKEYHPDLHPNDPIAAQKMNEINEAYDMLNNPGKYKREEQNRAGHSGSYQQTYGKSYGQDGWNGQNTWGGGYGGYGDFFGYRRSAYEPPKQSTQARDSESICKVVDFINMKQYGYACRILNTIVSAERDDRWYFLSSLANYGNGNQVLALDQIQKAVQMNPVNQSYQEVLNGMRQSGYEYNNAGRDFQEYAGEMGKICMRLFALQCFCMCCRC